MLRGRSFWNGAFSFLGLMFPAKVFIAGEHIPVGKLATGAMTKNNERNSQPSPEKSTGVPAEAGVSVSTNAGSVRLPVEQLRRTIDPDLQHVRGADTFSLLVIDDFHELGLLDPVDVEGQFLVEPDPKVKNLGDVENYVLLAKSLAKLGFYGVGRWLSRGFEESEVAVIVHPDTIGSRLQPKLVIIRLFTDDELLPPDQIVVPDIAVPTPKLREMIERIKEAATTEVSETRPHLQTGKLGRLLRRHLRKNPQRVG